VTDVMLGYNVILVNVNHKLREQIRLLKVFNNVKLKECI